MKKAALLLFCFILFASAAFANIYTVTNCHDSGAGSFRQAILDANANPGPNRIIFNIPVTDPKYQTNAALGAHWWRIKPATPFPDITRDGTFIDGTTQAAYIGGDPNPYGPEIELDGELGPSGSCLVINNASSCVIKGLVINKFLLGGEDDANGIKILFGAATSNEVKGCYVGLDALGFQYGFGNDQTGVLIIDGKNNIIGGSTVSDRNVISGNGARGIQIHGSGATPAQIASGNVIKGNFIGLDSSGTILIRNSTVGVAIGNYASNNIVGGTAPGESNVISGNGTFGVRLVGDHVSSNEVKGNFIGTNPAGTLSLPNVFGVAVDSSAESNVIEGNVISGNSTFGLAIMYGAGHNTVAGNFVGTNGSGTGGSRTACSALRWCSFPPLIQP